MVIINHSGGEYEHASRRADKARSMRLLPFVPHPSYRTADCIIRPEKAEINKRKT
jgi:hypothetical protein